MSSIVYLNGQYLLKDEARISPEDRGFIFGDGVYEATRALSGKLFEWPRHAKRLQWSLGELKIKPAIAMGELEKISLTLLEKNGLAQEAIVYLQITRGAAPRTHVFPPASVPCTVYLTASAFTPPHDLRKTGARVITVPDQRWTRCDLKTVNLLPAVLAKQQAQEAGAFEAVLTRDGVMIEGAYSSIFGVVNGVIRTHPLNQRILAGVTREVVVEIVRELKLPFEEKPIALAEVPNLSELFLTSSGNDVLPIAALDGNKIGNGMPGPVAQQLYAALAKRMHGKGVPLAA
ncbi:MAG: aminotransferase class IV [Proteobacteria bacterium]|nr:aminotransferase class IV [Pseudomonadota bacterium]